MCDLAALCCRRGTDFRVTVAEVHDADTSRKIEQLHALVGRYERALTLFENMLGEAANALCDVLLAKLCRIHVCGH